MPDENLLKFIKESQGHGRSEEVIRGLLLHNGWTQDNIDEAFSTLKNPKSVDNSGPIKSSSIPSDPLPEPETSVGPLKSSALNFFSYHGRIGRLKYFLGSLVIGSIVGICIFIFGALVFAAFLHLGQQSSAVIPTLWELAAVGVFLIVIPCILASMLIVKRFHDLGKSGVWWFALLIPIYNIYLGLDLLTQRGDSQANVYGDPVRSNVSQRDILDRVVGRNAIVKIVLTVLAVTVPFTEAILFPQPTFQPLLEQGSTYDVATSSLPTTAAFSSSAPFSSVAPQEPAANPLQGWKTLTVVMSSSSPPTCYTIGYPSSLTAAKWGNQPGWESFLQPGGGGAWTGVWVEPEFSERYDSVVRQQQGNGGTPETITTSAGLTGTELKVNVMGVIRFWEIFIPVSQSGINYVVAIYPANRNIPYDRSVAEEMAKSLTFSCTD